MADYDNTTWNEFEWERELRKDELRISCYFRELLRCMDLPGEEDLIYRKLMAHPELVPTGVKPDEWSMHSMFGPFNEDAEDDEDDYPLRRSEDVELIQAADRLAAEWNASAAFFPAEHIHVALSASCAFAKFIGRLTDLADVDNEAGKGLRLSLLKRTLSDLNELVERLRHAASYRRASSVRVRLLTDYLGHLREQLVDRLFAVRAEE